MRLSLHLLKQRLLEVGYIHSFKLEAGGAHVENDRKSGPIQVSALRYV